MPAKGFKERVLIPALRKQGLSVREARAVVNAVFGAIKDALGRHEHVELPIGSFTVLGNPKERGWRFGKVTTFAGHRLNFLASAELELAVAAAPPSPPPPKRKKRKEKLVGSELTISTELIVDFIRGNVYDWNIFFNELDAGPSIVAVYESARPKPHELRRLDEAAQVIAEYAPKEMPEEPWEQLYACISWFARWSQRVIPNPVWQEAMQQAKETLLPKDLFHTSDGRY